MKKFIDKKKADWRFRKAGPGHRLDEEHPKPQPMKPQPAPHRPPTESSLAAGDAAIARLETRDQPRGKNRSSGTKSLPASDGSSSAKGGNTPPSRSQPHGEPPSQATAVTPPHQQQQEVVVVDTSSRSAVVHLICPICKRSVPHAELNSHYASCLQEEYLKEPLTSSAQMIYTLCRDQEKIKLCVDTICKYLDNITDHPGEEKYQRIRINNKAFRERVLPMVGATLFLEAVGFQQQLLPHQDTEEQFYVLQLERVDDLAVHRELLTSTEPLRSKVDRNLQIFRPSSRATHFDLPTEFYNLTVEEIRREQKQRLDVAEREQVLRTRAMREREEMRAVVRHYRYTLLRVRMPDGLLLQGVFRPLEKLSEVRLFVSGALMDPSLVYTLSAFGKPLQDSTATLAVLGLGKTASRERAKLEEVELKKVPSAMLNLSWEGAVSPPFLQAELIARIQELL